MLRNIIGRTFEIILYYEQKCYSLKQSKYVLKTIINIDKNKCLDLCKY